MRERFESRLATAGLSLDMVLDQPVANERVRVDVAAVEHILFNLVDNTAKYATASEPPVLRISLGQRPGDVEIRVSDSGPGIPASEQRRIFRAFHKSARDAAESQPGVGLGLALSRRLARSLGGDLVCAEPEKGQGALFILTLPISRVD
jgi:signal transduction histidine kinase